MMSFSIQLRFLFFFVFLSVTGSLGDVAWAQGEELLPEAVEESPLSPPPSDELENPEIPSLADEKITDEDLFFDAESLVPTGEMGTKAGPRKVDPQLQPGSKLIVVKKDHAPDSLQAQLIAADRAVRLGRYEAALDMYDRLYARNKRDPNVIIGRAVALQQIGQTELAIQAYEELLRFKPDNVEAQVNMLGLMGQRYPAVALRRLIQLRDDHPESPGVAAQIAVVQAEMGHYNEALQYLGIAASIEPNNAGHLFNMAVIADRGGNKEEAIRYYEQALEVDTVYGGGRSIPRASVFERLAQLR